MDAIQTVGSRKGEPFTDSELLQSFAHDRDHAAFQELVIRHAPLVEAVCRSYVSDQECAEHAFQATFLAIVRQRDKLMYVDSMASWLAKTASRAAHVSQKRNCHTLDFSSSDIAADLDCHQSAIRDSLELVHALALEIQLLPLLARESVLLSWFEKQSDISISKRMSCSEFSTRRSLAQAKRILESRMARRGIKLNDALEGIEAVKESGVDRLPDLIGTTIENCQSYYEFGLTGPVPSDVFEISVSSSAESRAYIPQSTRMLVATLCFLIFCAASWGVVAINQMVNPQMEITMVEHSEEPTIPDFEAPRSGRTTEVSNAEDLIEQLSMVQRKLFRTTEVLKKFKKVPTEAEKAVQHEIAANALRSSFGSDWIQGDVAKQVVWYESASASLRNEIKYLRGLIKANSDRKCQGGCPGSP